MCLPGRREEGQAAPGSPASALGFSALHLCVCTRGPFNLALESPNLGGTQQTWGFPGGTDGKESACNAGYPSSTLGLVRKIPWRREWLPTPAFLPRESHGRGGLAGYKESQRVSEQLKLSLSLSTDLSTSPSPATCQLGELGQQSPAPWASVYLSMK